MSDEFLKPPQELERAAQEIAAMRRELQGLGAAIQGMSALLGRMEKRLRAAYPNYPDSKVPQSKARKDSPDVPRSRTELMAMFDALLAATKEGGDDGFRAEVEKLSPTELTALAHELGISDSKRLSVRKAHDAIRKRVQESIMLSPQIEKKGA